MIKKQFVLSASEYSSVKDAESKVNGWWKSGDLLKKTTKLYKVVETYDLKLKFVKRQSKSK